MDQSRAINALAPYVALAKSANSPRAAADLITQATSAPNTYVFAELLQQPNIQSLASNEQYAAFHTLLQCFAWGTWESYKSTPNLPPLSDAQALKLRLLSLLTIAATARPAPSQGPSLNGSDEHDHHLSYASLRRALDLASPIDLEHLVTTAIYSDLLSATLNPAAQTVVVTSVAPLRDLAPGSVQTMVADLAAWSARCDAVLADLDAEMRKVLADAEKRARREARAEKQVRAAAEAAEKAGGGGGGSGGGGGGGAAGAPGSVLGPIRGPQASSRLVPNKREQQLEGENDEDAMDVDGGIGARKKSAGGGAAGGGGLLSKFTGGTRR